MKKFCLNKTRNSNPWKTYLDNVPLDSDAKTHQRFIEKFWAKYEHQIKNNRPQLPTPPQIVTPVKDYTLLYNKYWLNTPSKIIYEQKKEKDSNNLRDQLGCLFIILSPVILLVGFSFLGTNPTVGDTVFLLLIVSIIPIVSFRNSKNTSQIPSNFTIDHIFDFDHQSLTYTKVDRYGHQKILAKIAYHQIKSIHLVHHGLRLKETYAASFQERFAHRALIKKLFIPSQTTHYKHVLKFMREIVLYNQQHT